MYPPPPSPAERARIHAAIEAMRPPITGHPRAGDDPEDRYVLAYTAPDGRRIYVRLGEDVTAAADAARCEALARAQGRGGHDDDGAPTTEPLWSRQPTPEQLDARDRAFNEFVGNLLFWTDEGMPAIAWRWVTDGDVPDIAGAWGYCRSTGVGMVEIGLRVEASPERIYSTTLHELTHAGDHELIRLGAPIDVLEQRARHIQHVLAEEPR
jgi:hypothetical protein